MCDHEQLRLLGTSDRIRIRLLKIKVRDFISSLWSKQKNQTSTWVHLKRERRRESHNHKTSSVSTHPKVKPQRKKMKAELYHVRHWTHFPTIPQDTIGPRNNKKTFTSLPCSALIQSNFSFYQTRLCLCSGSPPAQAASSFLKAASRSQKNFTQSMNVEFSSVCSSFNLIY